MAIKNVITTLDGLVDVDVPAPTNGYFLYWDAATSLWKCKAHTNLTTGVHGVGTAKIASVTTAAKTYYLDNTATGTGDGSSWANAFTSLQALWDTLPNIILHNITVYVAGTAYTGIHFSGKLSLALIIFYARNTADKPLYDAGVASGGAAAYIQDTTKTTWVNNQFDDGTVFVYWGTGKGQYRTIAACPNLATDQKLNVTVDWTTPPDNTSRYSIISKITITYTTIGNFFTDSLYFYGFQFINTERLYVAAKYTRFLYCKFTLDTYGIYLSGAIYTLLHYNLHLVHTATTDRGVYSVGSIGTDNRYSLFVATAASFGIGLDIQVGSAVLMYQYNHFVDLTIGIRALVGSSVGYAAAAYVSFSGCTTNTSPALGTDPSAIF